jgi:diaminohydroxyphosphoribosylaminopyrimidine deaminase/5-amino-6-(5-phosphoribosylamino)uracil reductase
VRWKYAATLDGRAAASDGTSRWITAAPARADVHRLRAEADAVLVGSGTARADDPHLAARGIPGAVQPLRVVADSGARAVSPGARVLDEAAPTLIAVAEDAPAARVAPLARHAQVVRLPRAAGAPGAGRGPGLDLHALLAELYRREVRSVLLEGGPTLAGAFAAAGLIDEITGYLAPALLGGGPQVLADAGITTIAQALRLRVTDVVPIGPDLRITAVPAPAAKES